MASIALEFLSLIERNFRFEYHAGGSTWVTHPHSTGWRVMPSLVVSHVEFDVLAELQETKSVRVKAGQTSCFAPGQMHRATMIGRRAGFSHWSHIQCEILQGVSLFFLIEAPMVIYGNRSLKIGRINRELGELAAEEPSMNSLLRRQALGWELITTIIENVPTTENRLHLVRNASRLTPVLAYIEENLGKPLSHELLARTAGLSPSRFHVLFRSALGSAPYEYVQKLRLKKALHLLIRTDRSVAEIGQEVGHPDPYHFSRMFRRSMGVSPAGYRKQILSRSL